MSKNKEELAKTPFRFVLIIGIVNLFADVIYEGARRFCCDAKVRAVTEDLRTGFNC